MAPVRAAARRLQALLLLRFDPALDLGIQDRERHRAILKDGVMEALHVEFLTQRGLRAPPQIQDILLPDFVGERLAGNGGIAVDFLFSLAARERCVRGQKSDRLFPRPCEPVDSGVDNQTARAPGVEGKRAEFLIRVAVKAELGSETFSVQAPAFDKGSLAAEASKARKCSVLRRKLRLQMVTRHALVEFEDFARVVRP